jgi:DNA-directed RNA polymerase subunit RPC12/RpoP
MKLFDPPKKDGPKVLIYDIETAPILAYIWGLWENNVSLDQIHSDWYILSWSAKWLGSPTNEIMYADQRNAKNIENDKSILGYIWELLDQADIVITQNGKAFDQKKLNSRFIIHGFQPPSSYKHIDTLEIAKKHFGFTSNKLAYMSDKLNKKYKKLDHSKFAGFKLWKECLSGNMQAWKEMEKYNKHDVLALEELYSKIIPWDNRIDFNLYKKDRSEYECKCGSKRIKKNGLRYLQARTLQKYKCIDCGAEFTGGSVKLPKPDKAVLPR